MIVEHNHERHFRELRLFLEEICCNLCRFQHVEQNGLAPEAIRIREEVSLGNTGSFADICVEVPGSALYFVEVKFGYPAAKIVSHMARKYGTDTPLVASASKIILVVDAARHADWPETLREIESVVRRGLSIEVWDEQHLLSLIHERFGVHIEAISESNVVEMRMALNAGKGRYAFGDHWANDFLQQSLLWHFGFWRLKQLRERHDLSSRAIMPPGNYKGVAVLMADLCSFSSFVRDTRDDEVARQCLTMFYSKARYEILNTGGMLYQFVGDEVIGLYGLPDRPADYIESALQCARALVDIGSSVANEWQRQIDRLQEAHGVHVGMSLGDIQVVSMQPFGRAHLGAIGDGINMAARLLAHACASEIVVSNGFYQGLSQDAQSDFAETAPIDARNIGRIKAWKLKL